MTKWPDSNGAVFRRYVRGLRLRTAMAARVYHCILRGFQRFISGYDPARPVSQASLTAWIQNRITVWPLHLVIHRARLVDRFLDYLVSGNHITENPLAKLRAEYRQHSTAPIVRALADPNPVAALEKLRTLPPFGSHLGPHAHTSPLCGPRASAMAITKTVSLLWIGSCNNNRMLPSSLSPSSFSDGRRKLHDSSCTWRGCG